MNKRIKEYIDSEMSSMNSRFMNKRIKGIIEYIDSEIASHFDKAGSNQSIKTKIEHTEVLRRYFEAISSGCPIPEISTIKYTYDLLSERCCSSFIHPGKDPIDWYEVLIDLEGEYIRKNGASPEADRACFYVDVKYFTHLINSAANKYTEKMISGLIHTSGKNFMIFGAPAKLVRFLGGCHLYDHSECRQWHHVTPSNSLPSVIISKLKLI